MKNSIFCLFFLKFSKLIFSLILISYLVLSSQNSMAYSTSPKLQNIQVQDVQELTNGDLNERILKSQSLNFEFGSNTNELLPQSLVPGSIQVKRVQYESVWNGIKMTNSGLLVLPSHPTPPLHFLMYHHHTETDRNSAPSGSHMDLTYLLASALSQTDRVLLLPDYIGLGTSTFPFHPYLHLESEAIASMDLLNAARTLLTRDNIKFEDQIFISGFSQGAHAAFSFLKMLQEVEPSTKILGTSGLSGPYDLLEAMGYNAKSTSELSPLVLAFSVVSFDRIYPHLGFMEKLVKPEYQNRLRVLFDGEHPTAQIMESLPTRIDVFIHVDQLNAILNNPGDPLYEILEKNSIFSFPTKSCLLFLHSEVDDVCPFKGAEKAFQNISKWNPLAQLKSIGKKFTHKNSFVPEIKLMQTWFQKILIQEKLNKSNSSRVCPQP